MNHLMELVADLTGSLLWATVFSAASYIASIVAIGVLSKKSQLLKPIGAGLNLIALFLSVQIFLYLGADAYYPHFSRHLNFLSWIVFTSGALKLALYMYGDLFVVRWKRGSFPAAFKNVITIVVFIVVLLILLKEILNINVTSLIATTTVLTATIGLAFQSTLANMLAGLTIHLEKPLKQGDWVSIGGQEGKVMDITLRSTRMLTIENNEVFIPNTRVLNDPVVNFSLPNTRVTRTVEIGVHYSVPPNRVKQVVLGALRSVADIQHTPEPMVRVLKYGEYSIHYQIRYSIIDYARSLPIEAELMHLLWYRFKRNGIEVPMPVRDIHLREITPASIEADEQRRFDEILRRMKKVEMLTALSDGEQRQLARQVRVETYSSGEFIFRQGDPGDTFCIVKSGRVDIVVAKPTGDSVVVATLGTGNFFGEMSLLTGAARTASVLVTEDVELIVIDKESFADTLIGNPSIAESLSRILSERQARLDAERERLDAASLARRQAEVSTRTLSKIREFFGLPCDAE